MSEHFQKITQPLRKNNHTASGAPLPCWHPTNLTHPHTKYRKLFSFIFFRSPTPPTHQISQTFFIYFPDRHTPTPNTQTFLNPILQATRPPSSTFSLYKSKVKTNTPLSSIFHTVYFQGQGYTCPPQLPIYTNTPTI